MERMAGKQKTSSHCLDSLEPIDLALVNEEWPASSMSGIYFNTGSCGIKPVSVLNAIQKAYLDLNKNPTIETFLKSSYWDSARLSAAKLFTVPATSLMLTHNSTYGIQLVMQNLLKEPGDEIVCTSQEHSCVKTLCKYLSETRGIRVRVHEPDAFAGSHSFCKSILNLVNSKTRLVLVSQINCLTGWRPNLSLLLEKLGSQKIPLLVDGAHAPGQGPVFPASYPFWVASAHKWMGAPNGTGFLKISSEYLEEFEPLLIGDRFYANEYSPAHRFEWPGTCDVVKLSGLVAALELQERLGPGKIAKKQFELQRYLRASLAELPGAVIRTPFTEGESSAMLAFHFGKQLKVSDLRQALYDGAGIWVQPDFAAENPGLGMRISCQVFNTEEQINTLTMELKKLLI